MACHEFATLLRQYRLLENEIESLNSHLAEMAKTTKEYELLASVPGLGDATNGTNKGRFLGNRN